MSTGTIAVRTPDGEVKTLSGAFGNSVMDILRAADLVEAICGGMCSCGTCLVRIAPEWVEQLASQDEIEKDMVDCLMTDITNGLRLGCQIPFDPALDGLSLEIVDQED